MRVSSVRVGCLFLMMLGVCLYGAGCANILLTVTTPTINQFSYYEFQIVDSGAWAREGTATLTFQSPPYSFANNTNISNCLQTVTSSYILSCYVSASNQISFKWTSSLVSNVGGLAGDSLTFKLMLQNPPYVDNFTISYSYYLLSDNSLYSSGSNTIKGLSPDSLTACSVSFSPNYTNSLATVTLQLTPKNSIPAGGSLQLSVSGYTTGSTLTSVSTNSNALLNSTTFISTSVPTYILANFFAATIPAGTALTFSANSLLSPPSTATSTYSFTLTTLYTTNYLNSIDTKSCSLSVTDYPLTVSVTFGSTFYVGNSLKPTITYTTPVDLAFTTDTFNFLVDSTSTTYLSISTANSVGSGGFVTGMNNQFVISNLTINGVANGVTYPTTSNSDTFTAATSIVESGGITVKSMLNSGTKTVFLQVFRNRNSYASGKATITIRPNSLYSVTINPLSLTVSAVTTYNFAITVRNPLAAGGGVRITLPSDLYIATGTCTATVTSTYGGAISSNNTCSATSNTVIFITNIFSAAFPTNTSFTVALANVLNPISAKQTAAFTFETFYSSSELTNAVDDSTQLSGLTITPSAASITLGNFAITRSSATNMQYSTYYITYTVTSKFKANGYITVTLPAYCILSSSFLSTFAIKQTNNLTVSSQTVTPSSVVGSISNVLTFNFSSLINSDLPAGTIITINVTSIRNYYSFKTVYAQMATFSSDASAIEQSGSTDVQLTNTAEDTTMTVTTATTTRINGNPTASTYQIKPTSPMVSGDVISTELQATGDSNTQMYYSSSLTCTVGGSGSCALDSSNSKLIYTTLATALTASTAYTYSIANIVLSRSFDQPGRIYFRTFEKSGTTLYNISSLTLTSPLNTQTNNVKTVSLSINELLGAYPSQLNQLQSFTLTVTTTNNFMAGDVIVVTIPSQYGFVLNSTITVTSSSNLSTMGGSLCTDSTLFCSNNDTSSGYLLRVQEKVKGNVFKNITSISFTVSNGTYRSPQLWSNYNSQSFLVNTYSSSGQPIDASTNTTTSATFYLACTNVNNHCGTCQSNGSCSSCYALGTGYDKTFNYGAYYYMTSAGTCVISCGGNFYNASNSCIQCTSPCYGCSGSATFCTSCITTTIGGIGPFYLYNNTCSINCPDGYFQDTNNICSVCSSTCATCSGSNVYCTSCNNGTYLSTRLNSCVTATQCQSYQYANSATWKCTNCSASCNGCSVNSTNCAACSTGYIVDITYGTTLPGRCTNVCPDGTVNDTAGAYGGGCTCSTTCKTCNGSLTFCLTCPTSKYLQNNTCVSGCSTGYYISGTSCAACVTNCSTCTSSTCSACSSGSYLYGGVCYYGSCPTYTTSTITGGVATCYSCGTGCSTCLDSTHCMTCASGLIPQQNDTNRVCVFSCSSGYVKITSTTSTYCATSCTGDTTAVNGQCIANTNTTTNNSTSNNSTNGNTSGTNTTITTSLTTSASRFIPFPYTIALVVLVIFTLTSRMAFSHTIVPAGLCAFGGLIEVLAWLTLIIVEGVDPSDSKIGLYVVLIAFILTIGLNIIHFILFRKYVWKDEKLQAQYKKLGKTVTGPCVTYSCIITSIVISHKFIEILFSNLFESGFFIYKVSNKKDLVPLNYIRYISLLPSVLAIIGGGIANYNLQTSSLSSIVFIQSIDVILVTIFSAIFGFFVTVRKEEDYENNLAEKRNDIEEELDHDMLGENVYHLEEEEKQGNKRGKYIHKSSIIVDDPMDKPIGKRNTNRVGPIGEELNFTNAPLGEKEDDFNRLNLNDITTSMQNRKKGDEEIDIDQINLEEDGGVDTLPPKRPMRNGVKTDRYRLEKSSNPDPQKQKIKNNIETKLTEEEIQKTKIVRDVDTIDTSQLEKEKRDKEGSESIIKDLTKNEIKKEKLEILSSDPDGSLALIPEGDRAKAGEMKNAMSILNAKKVEIGEYLEYLDIIEEEDEDRNSDYYDNQHLKNKDSKGKKKPADGKTGRKKNLVNTTNKKIQKKDRTARKVDDQLIVSIEGHNMYDDDLEPEIPDFHQTPIKGRKLSEDNYLSNEDEFNGNFSSLKKNQNRSDQHFSKKNALNDLVLVSLESGDNYDKSLAEEFKKGNTLQQAEKDELPPSNLYSTENIILGDKKGSLNNSIPAGRDRLIPNTLINDETEIQYLQSEGGDQQTIKGELLDFNNDVSPSHFNQLNMRIENEELSEAPTKPKITKMKGEVRVGQVENLQDQSEGYDEFHHAYDNNEMAEVKLQRYQSNQGMLDYDDIIHQRRNNQKVKELEKIYLPRQHVNRRGDPNRTRKNISSQSYRKQ